MLKRRIIRVIIVTIPLNLNVILSFFYSRYFPFSFSIFHFVASIWSIIGNVDTLLFPLMRSVSITRKMFLICIPGNKTIKRKDPRETWTKTLPFPGVWACIFLYLLFYILFLFNELTFSFFFFNSLNSFNFITNDSTIFLPSRLINL